jgi:hypothetical protein
VGSVTRIMRRYKKHMLLMHGVKITALKWCNGFFTVPI